MGIFKKIGTPKYDPKAEQRVKQILRECEEDLGDCLSSYFRSRGLSGVVPRGILYHPDLYYGKDGDQILRFPAMIAKFEQLDGTVVALLRTFLDPQSDGKAQVDSPKKITPALWQGALKGSAIRLAKAKNMIGIAEGVETGLAIMEAVELPVWVAGNAGNMEVIELPPEVETVIIWADNDRNGRGQKAAEVLKKRLLQEGRVVKVVIPPDEGTDWLDVYNNKGERFIQQYGDEAEWIYPEDFADNDSTHDDGGSEGPANASESSDLVSKDCTPGVDGTWGSDPDRIVDIFNKKHFIIDIGGKVCIGNEIVEPVSGRPNITFSSKADFRLKYSNCFVEGTEDNVVDVWLMSPRRRQYEGVVFSPDGDVEGFYNMFFGFAVEPKAGDCGLYWDHVYQNICRGNQTHYNFIRKWMAHAIQQPGQLPGTAIVLYGLQGTGKGVFVEYFGKLFGHHYLTVYRLDQITGRFNGHLKDVLLVHANEAIYGGGKSGESVLKGIITDPTTPIEYKGKDIVNVRNFKRLVVSTNEEKCVPIGMDDRRFLVAEVSSERKEDKAYFGAICHQMENEGGLEALMYDLLHEDLDGFDVRTVPPSKFNFNVKLHSASSVCQWWYEVLRGEAEDTSWDREPVKLVLYNAYTTWCQGQRLRPDTQAIFGKELQKMFPGGQLGESRKTKVIQAKPGSPPWESDKQKKRLNCYVLPAFEDCRKLFEQYSKSGPDIWPQIIEE